MLKIARLYDFFALIYEVNKNHRIFFKVLNFFIFFDIIRSSYTKD